MFQLLRYTSVSKISSLNFICDKLKESFFYFKKGDLVVIGAKPFYGKTSFFYDFLVKSIKKNKKCLLLDFSVDRDVSIAKLLSRYAETDYDLLIKNRLNRTEFNRYVAFQKELIDSKRVVIPSSVDFNIVEKLDKYLKKYNEHDNEKIEYIFLNFIQLFKTVNESYRYDTVSSIVLRLKQIAVRHGVTVFATSTFNRKFEDREDKKPRITDLRDSGAIEDCADYILLLDGYEEKQLAEKRLYVFSNHSSEPTTIKYKFSPKTKVFI